MCLALEHLPFLLHLSFGLIDVLGDVLDSVTLREIH